MHEGNSADVEFLRILHLSASTLEAQVEQVLARLLAECGLRCRAGESAGGASQVGGEPEVELCGDDALFVEQQEVAS